jgi:hypothetical protein
MPRSRRLSKRSPRHLKRSHPRKRRERRRSKRGRCSKRLLPSKQSERRRSERRRSERRRSSKRLPPRTQSERRRSNRSAKSRRASKRRQDKVLRLPCSLVSSCCAALTVGSKLQEDVKEKERLSQLEHSKAKEVQPSLSFAASRPLLQACC